MTSRDRTEERAARNAAPSGDGDDPGSDGAPGIVAGTYFDRARGPDLGTTIVRVVAEAEGVPPDALDGPPLYDRIDADHLEKALFDPRTDGPRQVTVVFSYHGHRIRVRGDGHVCVLDTVPTGEQETKT
jgi:methyl coenzyme M reductase gamma subunit